MKTPAATALRTPAAQVSHDSKQTAANTNDGQPPASHALPEYTLTETEFAQYMVLAGALDATALRPVPQSSSRSRPHHENPREMTMFDVQFKLATTSNNTELAEA